jgi:hypothetical protein
MSLLPHELINNSLDAYIAKHNTKSQMIYWVVLIAIIDSNRKYGYAFRTIQKITYLPEYFIQYN